SAGFFAVPPWSRLSLALLKTRSSECPLHLRIEPRIYVRSNPLPESLGGASNVRKRHAHERAGNPEVVSRRRIMARHASEGDAMQIDHVAIPVTDLATARAFYEQALAPFGVQALAERPSAVLFAGDQGEGMFALRQGTEYRTPMHVAFSTDRAGV